MLKMNDLVKLTNTPKSTILYYIKENILPEPHKDKPNFHLYDEHYVALIEFIKYLQTNFNASISQIKALFSHPDFRPETPYQSLIGLVSLIMGAENEHFTPAQLCAEFDIDETVLNHYVAEGLLSPREGIFTATERTMLAIIRRSSESETKLIHAYLQHARQLAELEIALADTHQNDEQVKHQLDLLLVLKPYLLNMQTLRSYQLKTKK